MNAALAHIAPVATTESALAAYALARTTGAAAAYETAAHALASALQTEIGRNRMRPATGAKVVRLATADGEPVGETSKPSAPAPAVAKSKRQPSRVAAADLDSPIAVPRKGHAAGAFTVTWSDGSETPISAVTWNPKKPDQRFALAYQAANRLRRLRSRKAYLQGLPAACRLMRRHIALGAGGVEIDSQQWLELQRVRVMPHLASVRCEGTGEVFSPPEGSAFGAGDAQRESQLQHALAEPRPIHRTPPAIAPKVRHPSARAGKPCAGIDLLDLHGASVTACADIAAAALSAALADVRETEAIEAGLEARMPAGQPHRADFGGHFAYMEAVDAWRARWPEGLAEQLEAARGRGREAESAFKSMRAAVEQLTPARGLAWALHRGPGGRWVQLRAGSKAITLNPEAVALLSFAA